MCIQIDVKYLLISFGYKREGSLCISLTMQRIPDLDYKFIRILISDQMPIDASQCSIFSMHSNLNQIYYINYLT